MHKLRNSVEFEAIDEATLKQNLAWVGQQERKWKSTKEEVARDGQ
jgi:hypothetical protein